MLNSSLRASPRDTSTQDTLVQDTSTETASDSAVGSASLLQGKPSSTAVHRHTEPESTSSTEQVKEQLNRVSEMVQSHDLIDPELSIESAKSDTRKRSSVGTELLAADIANTDLSTMSIGQINHLVSDLRRDKTRLQKLVIAQQSSIETERRAHEQSRTVARDAIVIMRDARSSQKLAEKLARRERTERQRVERQYKKVAKALNNAMSIIEKRKQEAGTADDNKDGAKSSIEDILG